MIYYLYNLETDTYYELIEFNKLIKELESNVNKIIYSIDKDKLKNLVKKWKEKQ